MFLDEDGYKVLYDVQRKCNELNRKIDSIIQIMEILTAYMKYSSMMNESPPEGSENVNPNDFQKILHAANQSGQQMNQDEFNQIFETLKQGKSAEEVARMEQMLQLAKSFMKS